MDILKRSEMVEAVAAALLDEAMGGLMPTTLSDARLVTGIAVDAIIALGKIDVILDDKSVSADIDGNPRYQVKRVAGDFAAIERRVAAQVVANDEARRLREQNDILRRGLLEVRALALTGDFRVAPRVWDAVLQTVNDTFAIAEHKQEHQSAPIQPEPPATQPAPTVMEAISNATRMSTLAALLAIAAKENYTQAAVLRAYDNLQGKLLTNDTKDAFGYLRQALAAASTVLRERMA